MLGNSDEREKRLRDLLRARAGPSTSAPQTAPPVINHQGILRQDYYHRIEEKADPLQEEIDRYVQTYFGKDIPESYYAEFTLQEEPVRYDFLDKEWIGKPGIMLDRYTDETIAAIGRVVIPMLSSGFSPQGAAAIFILAYHLKAPGSKFRTFVFNRDETLQVMTDERYTDYPEEVINSCGNHKEITATDDPKREAAVYSYVAASMFRLFTKPASNYVKAWSHILSGFSKFYSEPMRVILPTPTVVAVDSLKFWFSAHVVAKVTLYRLLYISNSDESHEGLKRFLYDIHLSNTGMHIVNIILQLCKILKCDQGLILTAIKGQETEEQVNCLTHLFELLVKNDENHQRKMWRYGRLFDETFMRHLQTKSCPELVYILAEALRSEAPDTHSGILQITQLADVSEEKKRECATAAQVLLTHLKSQNPWSI